MIPPILIIAGSDSGGGAGVQADIKAVTCNGAYAATAITALTAQNTRGVQAVHPVPPDFILQQARAVLDDIGAAVIKTGMLHHRTVIDAVAGLLEEEAAGIPLICDPVMVATSGDALLDADAVEVLKTRLLPRARLLTPNIPEAEALTGLTIADEEGMDKAAQALLAMGPEAVLLKGGHLPGESIVDLLVTRDGAWRYTHLRIDTPHTHGTGCTLASAIAAHLAQGLGLADSVEAARDYLIEAMRHAPKLGNGHGPLGHGWNVA